MSSLSQRCSRCSKIKPGNVVSRRKCKGRYNKFYYICDHCASQPADIKRNNRFNKETPPERVVREALKGCGFKCEAEFELGGCLYDFAVPRLMLLMEIDTASYHRYPRQKRRDAVKSRIAHDNNYKLVRVHRDLGMLDLRALRAVEMRKAELGIV